MNINNFRNYQHRFNEPEPRCTSGEPGKANNAG